MVQGILVTAVYWVVKILTYAIIADALLTFIPSIDRRHPAVKLLRSVTEPMYRPLRRLIPAVRMGDVGFDLAPMIAILALWLIGQILIKLIIAT